MVTLKQLRCLVALSDTLNFHRAAERLHVTQPAFSNQIRLMEEMLGTVVVERTSRRVMLTPLGRDLAERARRILADVNDFTEAARQAQGPLGGMLRLGILPTLGPYLLPHILPELRATAPDLRLYLREEPARRLLGELKHGELDLLVVSLPVEETDLVSLPLFAEPFWAALPANHPLAASESVTPAQVAGLRLLALERGHCMRDQVLAWARALGGDENPDFRATSLDSLRQMVATGLGPTLLPALYVAAEALEDEQLAMRPVTPQPPERVIGLVWRRTGPRADEFRRLAGLVRARLPGEVVRPLD